MDAYREDNVIQTTARIFTGLTSLGINSEGFNVIQDVRAPYGEFSTLCENLVLCVEKFSTLCSRLSTLDDQEKY